MVAIQKFYYIILNEDWFIRDSILVCDIHCTALDLEELCMLISTDLKLKKKKKGFSLQWIHNGGSFDWKPF